MTLRFAQFLSQERKARAERMSRAERKTPPKAQPPSQLPAAPDAAPTESKPEAKSEKAPTTEPAKAAVPKLEPAPKPKTAVERVMESQVVEVQERAYVTFPYSYPTQQFFGNPFESTTHSITYADPPHASFMDPVYTGRNMEPADPEVSSGSWRGDQSTSFSSSSLSGQSSTFSEYYDSDQSSYTYYENAYQMYPKTQSTQRSSQPAQGSSARYQDYFNIFG